MQGGQMVAAETTAAETTATQRMQWRAKSWGSIMFLPVSMAKRIQESGSYFFSFVLNPCFPVRLNFHSRLPLHITLLTFLLASILGHVVGRSQGSKFCMRDCFTNTSGIQYFNNVSIIFCNRCEHCSEFNVPGSGGFLTPSLTSAPTHVSFGHSLPTKSQDGKVVLSDNFTNTNGIQYFSNVKIIFCNRCGLGSEFNVPSEAMADSGSTVGFMAPPLTSAPNPVSFARNQPNKMDESCHPLWNKVSISPSKINPCRILIVLSIAVLVYLIHYKILHSVNDAYALPQWYASFYPFITADTILSTKEERRAIKREHEELKVSERVPGDGDGTSGPKSVRDHHRMIQVPVSAVISNAPYLLNVDCGNYINIKAFFEAMYFMMDSPRYDRCSCRNVVLLDINIKGLDCNQGPIYVGTGCSLGGRQPMDMMPLLRKNAQRKTCNFWPKWCYLCCGSRIKNRKVKSILRKKIENKGNTRQIHAVGNIEGMNSEKSWLISQQIFEKKIGQSSMCIATIIWQMQLMKKRTIHAVNCGYEDKTELGKEDGWIYGFVKENILTDSRGTIMVGDLCTACLKNTFSRFQLQ